MNFNKLIKYTASLFMIWLMIMIPMEVSEALSYISTPEATNVTHESVVIEWGSDVIASGNVYYGEENMTS